MLSYKNTKGFSLIELLVVIAIIGLLSTLAVVSLNNARMKARDTRRLGDMKSIKLALDMYYDLNGVYPGGTHSYGEASATCGGWDSSKEDMDGDGKAFIEPLVDVGLLTATPSDPNDVPSFGCGNYNYYLYGAGDYGCDSNRGAYYVLGVVDLEGTAGAHANSPGWNCPGRNWQNEFEWVTGSYTR